MLGAGPTAPIRQGDMPPAWTCGLITPEAGAESAAADRRSAVAGYRRRSNPVTTIPRPFQPRLGTGWAGHGSATADRAECPLWEPGRSLRTPPDPESP